MEGPWALPVGFHIKNLQEHEKPSEIYTARGREIGAQN